MLALVAVIVRYVELRFKKRSSKEAFSGTRSYFLDNFRTPLVGFLCVVVASTLTVGAFKLYRQGEQRVANYDSLVNHLDNLQKQDDELIRQVRQLTPKPEPAESLRRRTMRLADEMEKYLKARGENEPPLAGPDSSDPNPSEERRMAIKKSRDYQQATFEYYSHHFKDRMIGIIREYDAKGVRTGWLEKSAEQRVPLIVVTMESINADDLDQFRELAYHVDANDRLIVF